MADQDVYDSLENCFLFLGISRTQIKQIIDISTHTLKTYSKNRLIASEGDRCSQVGIVIYGAVEIKKIFAPGNTTTITKMEAGEVFGEALVFSHNNRFPATIEAREKTSVLYITKSSMVNICSKNEKILSNLLSMLSNKLYMMSEKVRYLSYQTIKQKIAAFLIDEHARQQNRLLVLRFSRKEMAEHLGVTRPSLSRGMAALKREGIIDFKKNLVTIEDINAVEELLRN